MLIHQDANEVNWEFWIDLDKICFINKKAHTKDDGNTTIEYNIFLIGDPCPVVATEETVQKILKEKGVT